MENSNQKFIAGQLQRFFLIALLYFVIYSIQRYALYLSNISLADNIDTSYVYQSFLTGLPFDLLIISAIFLPVILGSIFFRGRWYQKLSNIWLYVCLIITLFLGIVEIEFYQEFHARLNSLVFEYIKEDPKTVLTMIISGLPVFKYLAVFLLIAIALFFIFKKIDEFTQTNTNSNRWAQAVVFTILLVVCVIGARGGKVRSGPPLRWGDAYTSDQLFTNQLGLNPIFTLTKAVLKPKHDKSWVSAYKPKEALEITQDLIKSHDQFLETDQNLPIYRLHTPKNGYSGKIKNIVVVLMESFAADHIGAINPKSKITPEFDKMTEDGLLFTRFFSNGTHTHQGMFATIASWPNLPGYEYMMQQVEGQNKFSAFTEVLQGRIDHSAYIYNGDFSWDNQRGFFANQGMEHFVGRGDFKNPKFISPTWGVSDQDMFDRAVTELDALNQQSEPFFAVIQTLSNHLPFDLPNPLPVERALDENGNYSERLTAMRYADWALGQFYKEIKTKPYYKDTLFVFLGDHGFPWRTQMTDMDLTRFHIPLLLVAPNIQDTFGKTSDVVGSQVDVMPTAVSLLNKPFKHQGWGRDLLSLPKEDKGYAIIKPSGSDPRVAMVYDDNVLTFLNKEQPNLWQYDFSKNTAKKIDNKPLLNRLDQYILGYIQTATLSLQSGTVGLPIDTLWQRDSSTKFADKVDRKVILGYFDQFIQEYVQTITFAAQNRQSIPQVDN